MQISICMQHSCRKKKTLRGRQIVLEDMLSFRDKIKKKPKIYSYESLPTSSRLFFIMFASRELKSTEIYTPNSVGKFASNLSPKAPGAESLHSNFLYVGCHIVESYFEIFESILIRFPRPNDFFD